MIEQLLRRLSDLLEAATMIFTKTVRTVLHKRCRYRLSTNQADDVPSQKRKDCLGEKNSLAKAMEEYLWCYLKSGFKIDAECSKVPAAHTEKIKAFQASGPDSLADRRQTAGILSKWWSRPEINTLAMATEVNYGLGALRARVAHRRWYGSL
jgi:hypothetical protein